MENKKTTPMWMKILIVVFIIGSIFSIVRLIISSNNYNKAYAKNVEEIGTLNDKLTTLSRKEVKDTDEVRGELSSAREVGKKLEDLQNVTLRDIDVGSEAGRKKLEEVLEEYKPYFEDDSLWGRISWFKIGANQQPEYQGLDYEWGFKSTYAYSGDKIDVLWLCKDDTGDLLAIVTGVYDAKTKRISNLKIDNTTKGIGVSGIDNNEVEDGLITPDYENEDDPTDTEGFYNYLDEFSDNKKENDKKEDKKSDNTNNNDKEEVSDEE